MKQLTYFLIAIMGAALLAGCGGKKKATMPVELPTLAAEFKAAEPGEAKIELAKKIKELLPTAIQGGDSGMVVRDPSNPSYVLTVENMHALFGQPKEVTADGYHVYELGKGAKDANFFLLAEEYEGTIISGLIDVSR